MDSAKGSVGDVDVFCGISLHSCFFPLLFCVNILKRLFVGKQVYDLMYKQYSI